MTSKVKDKNKLKLINDMITILLWEINQNKKR